MRRVSVEAHAGSVALRLLADQSGLTGALWRCLFLAVHDRGRVLTDVAVMLADGGAPRRVRGLRSLADWSHVREHIEQVLAGAQGAGRAGGEVKSLEVV